VGACRSKLQAVAIAAAALLLAAPAASASDASSTPALLAPGVTSRADTRGFGVEPGEQNTAAPFTQQCGSPWNVGAARTAWYAVQGTGGSVSVTTGGSDYDTSLFVYAGSPAGGVVACNDDASDSSLQSSVSFTSTAGTTYVVQVGRACNETGPPTCPENPAAGQLAITATAATSSTDLDGDGYVGAGFGGPDCNDAAAAIHVGAPDVPHDGVDQDCNGRDAPYPRVRAKTSISVLYFGARTKVASLRLTGALAGTTVTISCAPKRKGCPFKHKTVAPGSAKQLQLAKHLRKARLEKGASVTVLVSKPGFIGTLVRYSVRVGNLPRRTDRCVQPGQQQPRKKCS
jgi:hypothetical protein